MNRGFVDLSIAPCKAARGISYWRPEKLPSSKILRRNGFPVGCFAHNAECASGWTDTVAICQA